MSSSCQQRSYSRISTAFLISIEKVTKESKFRTTQYLYTKPNFRSDKVANLQFLLKSLMKNGKHHKKCLLFSQANLQNNIIYNVTPTRFSNISFYYEIKLIRQAMVKNSLLIHKKCSDSSESHISSNSSYSSHNRVITLLYVWRNLVLKPITITLVVYSYSQAMVF